MSAIPSSNKHERKCISLIEEELKQNNLEEQLGCSISDKTINKINNIFKLSGLANGRAIGSFLAALSKKIPLKNVEFHTINSNNIILLDWIYLNKRKA